MSKQTDRVSESLPSYSTRKKLLGKKALWTQADRDRKDKSSVAKPGADAKSKTTGRRIGQTAPRKTAGPSRFQGKKIMIAEAKMAQMDPPFPPESEWIMELESGAKKRQRAIKQ